MRKINNSVIKYVIIGMIVLVIAIGAGAFTFNKLLKENKKVVVKHETVDKLYDIVKSTSCTYIEQTTDDKFSDNTLLYIIFSKLKSDGKLTEEIDVKEYKKAAKTTLGDEQVIPLEFSNYEYDGYSYTLSDGKITRTIGTCSDKKYISKLYGYTFNEEELIVTVKVAYIKDDKLYDLDNIEIAPYVEDNQNKLMDSATNKIYTYKKNGNDYILKSITNDNSNEE